MQSGKKGSVNFNVQDGDGEARSPMKVLQPWELEENNMNTFLFKLQTAVQKIDQYKSHVGLDKQPRTMKMQGVLKEDCKIDLQKHFAKHDYKSEIKAAEQEKERKRDEKESRTTVGAVKRLIEKFSSLSINNENIMNKDFGSSPKRPKRRLRQKNSEHSATDAKPGSRQAGSSFSLVSGGQADRSQTNASDPA